MATHSSILAWRIPQTEEPGGLQSIGILRNKVYGSLAFKTGEGNGTPLQHSCLENPMDGGAWRATVHRVAESNTTEQLSTQHTHSFLAGLEWLLFLNDMNFYLILIY